MRQRANMVDAVATVVPRIARARTAVIEFGKVIAVVSPICTVQVGIGLIDAAYHSNYTPVAGDIVTLINDRDIWIVVGKMVGGVWVGDD